MCRGTCGGPCVERAKFLLEKPTSVYSVIVAACLLLCSMTGMVFTFLSDLPAHTKNNATAACGGDPQSEAAQIISFLLFGYSFGGSVVGVLLLAAEFYRRCCTEGIDARLGFLTSNLGKALVSFFGGVASMAVGLVFSNPRLGPGNPIVGTVLLVCSITLYVATVLNFLRQLCGVGHDGEADLVYFAAG